MPCPTSCLAALERSKSFISIVLRLLRQNQFITKFCCVIEFGGYTFDYLWREMIRWAKIYRQLPRFVTSLTHRPINTSTERNLLSCRCSFWPLFEYEACDTCDHFTHPKPSNLCIKYLGRFFSSGTESFATNVAANFLRISALAQITKGGHIQRRSALNLQRHVHTMSATNKYSKGIKRN